jgi:hypothetical protein
MTFINLHQYETLTGEGSGGEAGEGIPPEVKNEENYRLNETTHRLIAAPVAFFSGL